MELVLIALERVRTASRDMNDIVKKKLKMAETAINGVVEVLSMRAHYFRDITEQGVVYYALPHIYNFSIVPSHSGKIGAKRDCEEARENLQRLLESFTKVRDPNKEL